MLEFKEGQVYKRIEGPNFTFTVGRKYPVRLDENGVPFIESDNGAPWYSGEIIDDRFELVEDNKENEDMIKKGDIVEVIETDYYADDEYEVGTTWCVLEDVRNSDPYDVVKVYDSRIPTNEASLFIGRVKKLEPEPDPQVDVEPVFINVETLLKNITMKKLTSGEIVAYLEGYVKGVRY